MTSSPEVIYFSTPPPSSPQTVAAFHALIVNTLDQQSFVVELSDYQIVYQAPDRAERIPLYPRGLPVIVIGDTQYAAMASDKAATQWGEGPADREVQRSDGPAFARSLLRGLLKFSSVVREGGRYVVREVRPRDDQPGQILLEVTMRPRDGYVSTIQIQYDGIAPNRVVSDVVRYIDVNNAPPVVPPPKNQTIKLVPCKGRTTGEFNSSGYVCGMLN